MREIVHIQAGQCGNQIGAKVNIFGDIEKNRVNIIYVLSMWVSNHHSYDHVVA